MKQRRCGEEYLQPQFEQWVSECDDFLMNRNTIWMETGWMPSSSTLTDRRPVGCSTLLWDVILLLNSWRICLDSAPVSQRHCSIIICFAQYSREWQEGWERGGDLGTTLHFFSWETWENCGALLESVNQRQLCHYYFIVFFLHTIIIMMAYWVLC